MSANPSYDSVASAYASAIRAFYEPVAAPTKAPTTRDRSSAPTRAPSSTELVQRAVALAPNSDQIRVAAAAKLDDADPLRRAEAASQLLAKALFDLDVSQRLIAQAEADTAEEPLPAAKAVRSRGATISKGPLELLDVIEGKARPALKMRSANRGAKGMSKATLTTTVSATMTLISERAGDTGVQALDKILEMGAFELLKGVELASLDVANLLGKGEDLLQIYQLGKDYLQKAYDALKALIGEALVERALSFARDWLEKLKQKKAEYTAKAIEKLFATETTGKALATLIEQSAADAVKRADAAQHTLQLSEAYRGQVETIEKYYKYVGYARFIPLSKLPQGKLVIALVYLLLGGYIVFAGADFVDSPNADVRLLNRVPGVKSVVETALA